MKLLKLNNGNNLKSQWTNHFDNLQIKPNAKLALQSISLEVSNTIYVTDENRSFAIQLIQNTGNPNILNQPYTIEIPTGTYTNVVDIQNAVERGLNMGMRTGEVGIDPDEQVAETGMQWKLSLDQNYLSIGFKKRDEEPLLDVNTTLTSGQPMPDATGGETGYLKTVGDGTKWDGVLSSKVPASISSNIITLATFRKTGTDSNWCIGLTDVVGPEMPPENYNYAIYSRGDGEVYYTAGTLIDIPFATESDDEIIIEIRIDSGDIILEYNGQSSGHIPFEYTENNYFCVSIMELNNFGIEVDGAADIMWIPSAYTTLNDDGNVIANNSKYYLDTNTKFIKSIRQQLQLTPFRYISFQNSKLGNILGFQGETPISSSTGRDGAFVGQYKVASRVLPTSLNVYIPNLNLDGYSAYTGDKENILAVLGDVNFQENTYKYVYEIMKPIFVDIGNQSNQTLNEILIKLSNGDERNTDLLDITKSGCTLSILLTEAQPSI